MFVLAVFKFIMLCTLHTILDLALKHLLGMPFVCLRNHSYSECDKKMQYINTITITLFL